MKLDLSLNRSARRRMELAALATEPVEVTRSLVVGGERRAVRLEADIWDAFRAVAEDEGGTVDQLAGRIAAGLQDGVSLAAGVRVFVLNCARRQASAAETPV